MDVHEIDYEQVLAQRTERLNEITEDLESFEADICLQSLKSFVFRTWHIVEPVQLLRWNWHLDEIVKILESITDGSLQEQGYRGVILNVPPGTMKSLLINVFWRAWEWARNPALRYLSGSYGSHLTIRDNLKVRDIVQSSWYQKHYHWVELSSDQNAKENIKTTEGGWLFATSVGGAGTGEHPDRVIVDDPLTAIQARSEVYRQGARDWIDRTLSTRGLSRGVFTLLVMQRLHHEDPTAHLKTKGGYLHVIFPMRYEAFRPATHDDPGHIPDPRDHRYEQGQLLWESLFPEHVVKQSEIDLGPYGAAGQLQQKPAPEGGGLFKRAWFKFVSVSPKRARRARGWDTAASDGVGDYTVGVRIAEADDKFFIENVVRGQWSPAQVDENMKLTAMQDGKKVAIREEREPGGSGKTVTSARLKALKGWNYKEVIVNSDKVTRSLPFRAQVEGGNVFIVQTGDPVRDAWISIFLAELEMFPVGAKDDQVDGATCAFNAVLLEPKPQTSATWGRDYDEEQENAA